MLDLVHRLPDIAILVLVVGSVVMVAVLAPSIGSRLLRLEPSKARDDAAFDAYKAVMAMAGVVLAFSLVEVNNNLRAAQTTVGHEAAMLSAVDRTLLRFGSTEAAQARPLLAAFGQSLVDDEWPALARGERSDAADARYAALSRTARALDPVGSRQQSMYAELLKTLDDLSDARETLIEDAEDRLPDFFWIVTGGFLGLGLVLALAAAPGLTRAAALGGTAAGVGLLLAFVMIVDQPLKGQTHVSPDDIQKALVLNSHRV